MWENVPIGSLGKVITGKTPPTDQAEYWGGDELFVSPKDMERDSRYIYKTQSLVTLKAIEKFKNQTLPRNAVMYTALSYGFGKIGIASKKLITNQQINSIIVNEENDYRFVYYLLRVSTPYIFAYNSGIDTPIVPKSVFEKIKVLVPKLSTQKKIADILSAYDDFIENNNKRIELLEKAANEIFKEWFVRMRFPGYKSLRFENGIPQGWEIKRISDFGRVETGKTPPTFNIDNYGGNIMFIKTPDMHGKLYVIETGEYLTEIGHSTQHKKLLPANSISVSCIGTGGIVSINAEPAHTNQQINSIILDDIKYLEWMFFTARSLKQTIEMFGSTGTTMTNLSKGKFEKLKVICPTEELVYQFNEIASPILEEVKCLLLQNSTLVKQRDLLLPRLISGKIELD
ncbi:restriction endonuclease subunit S [Metabacillus hrfriensis]|uniref:Restriction endonuclease subunit S n=1 Tax=Metabacillus hrfriensis TaxID=3048891 RepID=A0ACD4RF18_9BACI|nr:restriction endonuclease subunit S [Metabacillus sp. CT-WN-B3]WHZ58780.1 restriction endonuclease subunit S [Metabacillus sp. CT-WN-B3]